MSCIARDGRIVRIPEGSRWTDGPGIRCELSPVILWLRVRWYCVGRVFRPCSRKAVCEVGRQIKAGHGPIVKARQLLIIQVFVEAIMCLLAGGIYRSFLPLPFSGTTHCLLRGVDTFDVLFSTARAWHWLLASAFDLPSTCMP